MPPFTEKQIFDKLKAGYSPPIRVIAQIVKKPLADMCVNVPYIHGKIVQSPSHKGELALEEDESKHPHELIVTHGTTKQLKRIGINEEYGGWSHTEKRGNKTRREIWINNETKLESQIVTLAHETGHHVLKNAVSKKVGKKEAEEKAEAFERVFTEKFNERYGKYGVKIEGKKKDLFKPSLKDKQIVKANIKPIYLNKKCSKR